MFSPTFETTFSSKISFVFTGSPADCSKAFLTSETETPVSSLNCFICSILIIFIMLLPVVTLLYNFLSSQVNIAPSRSSRRWQELDSRQCQDLRLCQQLPQF